jgi:hypothetical protein
MGKVLLSGSGFTVLPDGYSYRYDDSNRAEK